MAVSGVTLLTAIDFRAQGNSAAFTGEGFSAPEPEHCWGLAPRSVLTLPAPPPGRRGVVLIRLSTVFFHPPDGPGLRVAARIGGETVFDAHVRPGVVIGIAVPETVIGPTLVLILEYPGAVPPAAAGHAETRPLTARFAGLWLLAADDIDEFALKRAATGFGAPRLAEPIMWAKVPANPPVAATDGRAVVVVAGNCIAERLAAGLATVADIADRFMFTSLPVHADAFDPAAGRRALEAADIVFVQGISLEAISALDAEPRPGCRFIPYPDIVLRSLWPFNAEDARRDDLYAARAASRFRHMDRALERLREIEPRPSQRVARYERLDIDIAAAIPRTIAAQARFLSDIDRAGGTGIGRFIAENYRAVPLFCDSVHPAGIMLRELCRILLAALDIRADITQMAPLDTFTEWRVPVHPAIAARLGVRWAGTNTRYAYKSLGQVTWREWVEAYVAEFG